MISENKKQPKKDTKHHDKIPLYPIEVNTPKNIEIGPSKFVEGELGVITKRDFQPDEILFEVTGTRNNTRTIYSLELNSNIHIEPIDENGNYTYGHYLNHSCTPNAKVKHTTDERGEHLFVVAHKVIPEGEETTVNYATMEYETTSKRTCECKSVDCRKKIHGFKDLPHTVKKQYIAAGLIPQPLLEKYKKDIHAKKEGKKKTIPQANLTV